MNILPRSRRVEMKADVPPAAVLDRLRRREDEAAGADQICRGTLLSRQQYLHETNVEGYLDAREYESKDWTGDQAYPVRYPARSEGQDDAHRGGR